MTKVYNLRLPEPYLLKLRYIADNTPDSMQIFCLNVVKDVIDKKINELTKGEISLDMIGNHITKPGELIYVLIEHKKAG